MKTVNIHAAKTNLSSLVEQAAASEEIIIAKAGKATARLVPLDEPDFRKSFGMWKGKIRVSDDFDAPLPPEILRSFGVAPRSLNRPSLTAARGRASSGGRTK
jgi:prevent-host-death family protein